MGGRGSGGLRPGSGRKPKDAQTKVLHGTATRAERKDAQKPVLPLPVMPPPDDLPGEQKAVWLELAPLAAQQRTLTAQTARAFRDLCEAIVLKRAMLEHIQNDGLTYLKITTDVTSGEQSKDIKAHPLLSQHRGMMQRVEAGMLRFRLSPIGKEVVPTEQPQDEWAEFDDTGSTH